MRTTLTLLPVTLLAVLSAGCEPRPESSTEYHRLPAAFGSYLHVDNTLVFVLPDSGGWIANGAPLDSSRLQAVLTEVFAPRRPEMRAVFVWYNPRRPWPDYEVIARAARAAGGYAFDADHSGWPREILDPPLPDSAGTRGTRPPN